MYRPLLLLVVVSVLLGSVVAADVDGGGLPSVEETRTGTAAVGVDTDGGGLVDADGGRRATNQHAPDTDSYGPDDPSEQEGGTDRPVADSDDDGLADDLENELGTDPLVADSDDDGLADGAEVDLGTDPLDPDTDGDGFTDGVEGHRTDVLPGADPLRIDVFVEVDVLAGARLPRSEVDRVVDEFADAPVGREGARGIALHVVFDETGLTDRGPVSVTGRSDVDGDETVAIDDYGEDHRDYRGYGYHYLLVVPEVQDVERAEVLGESGDGELIVQSEERPDVRGSTLMHELGHSLGLDSEDFDGIDAYEYTAEEYPSVLNYNTGTEYYGFSAGDPFDDWAAIVDDPYVPDTSRLEEHGEGEESDA